MALSGKRFTVPHPTEAGVSFEFATVGWKSKQDARQARQHEQFGGIRHMGPEIFEALTAAEDRPKVEREAAVTEHPNGQFDTFTILVAGIVGWAGPEYDRPVSAATIALLDEATMEWAKGEILAASEIRPLVSTSGSPSTAPSAATPPLPFPTPGS